MFPFYFALFLVFGFGVSEARIAIPVLAAFGLLSITFWLTYFIQYEIAFD